MLNIWQATAEPEPVISFVVTVVLVTS